MVGAKPKRVSRPSLPCSRTRRFALREAKRPPTPSNTTKGSRVDRGKVAGSNRIRAESRLEIRQFSYHPTTERRSRLFQVPLRGSVDFDSLVEFARGRVCTGYALSIRETGDLWRRATTPFPSLPLSIYPLGVPDHLHTSARFAARRSAGRAGCFLKGTRDGSQRVVRAGGPCARSTRS